MKVEVLGKKEDLKEEVIQDMVLFFEKALFERQILEKTKKKLILCFCSLEEIKNLNKKFLKKNRPTDVLSFKAVEEGVFGELALCLEKVKEQARSHDLLFEQELAYLLLHGMLHLLGFHHEAGGDEAKKMYQIQDEIFQEYLKEKKE